MHAMQRGLCSWTMVVGSLSLFPGLIQAEQFSHWCTSLRGTHVGDVMCTEQLWKLVGWQAPVAWCVVAGSVLRQQDHWRYIFGRMVEDTLE